MRNFFFLLSLLAEIKFSSAQNLIPNPGFEDTGNVFCGIYLQPDFNSSVNYWYAPTQGTPDVYSTMIAQSCWNFQPNSTYPGPACIVGSQLPRTGNVFIGQGHYTIPGLNQREYIQSPLITPMIPGNIYYVEYYVSFPENKEKYTDRLGAHFSVGPIGSVNDGPLNFIPQVTANGFISDTANWVKVSGTFLATSPFDYITIGNFYDDAATATQINPNGSSAPGCYGAYYYVDDVLVEATKSSGIYDIGKNAVYFSPNPFTGRLFVKSDSNVPCEVSLFDITGRIILNQLFIKSVSLDTELLASGVYFCEVKNKYGRVKLEKLIRN